MVYEKRLRGCNFGGWLSQIDALADKDPDTFNGIDGHLETFITGDDFAQQKRWGFNHIRLPVDSYVFFNADEKPIASRFIHLDNAITWARNYDLSLILDLHECPGHDFADAMKVPVQKLFSDPEYLLKTEKIWTVLAERYQGEDHVLFEPLNEPVAPNGSIWNKTRDKLCTTIRKYAPRNTIVVGSNLWNNVSTYNEMTPANVDNVLYNFHFYEPLLFTHQGAPWVFFPEIKQQYTYPGDFGSGVSKDTYTLSAGRWDRNRLVSEIEPVIAFARKNGASILCNEFGVYTPVPVDLQMRWLDDVLSIFNEYNVGFTYWNYKNLDFGIISRGEKQHASLPHYDNPERINHQVLELLRK